MDVSDTAQRRISLSISSADALAPIVPSVEGGPIEPPPSGELGFGPPPVSGMPTAELARLGLHSRDELVAQPRASAPMEPQLAEFVATLRREAGDANQSFDAFDPEALTRTRDLLEEMGRPGEAIALQRQILRLTGDGAQRLTELMKLADLCLDAGQPKAAIDAIDKARPLMIGLPQQARSEILYTAALARALVGDRNAKWDLRSIGAHFYDEAAQVLKAVVHHASGEPFDVSEALHGLEDPAHRVLLLLGCHQSEQALAELDAFVRAHVPAAGVPLDDEAHEFALLMLRSPIVACSPARALIEASDSWKLLRECFRPEELAAIDVKCPLPDLRPHVVRALADMQLHELARMVEHMEAGTDEPYWLVTPFYRHWDDPQINMGVQLEESGRQLLATYLNRKWGASIQVHPKLTTAADALHTLIEQTTGTQDEVRRSLTFGVHHGVSAVYVRKEGKEALYFFDSLEGSGQTAITDVIDSAVRKTGRKIPMYRQALPTQTDFHSCFVQSIKAAVTLTRRVPDGNGGFGEFLIPDLIGDMERTEMQQERFDPFIPTPGWPEISKLTQSPVLLQDHLAVHRSAHLRDTRRDPSLQGFVQSHVVPIKNAGKSIAVLDYSRQKGLRYAKNIDIEQWIQVILTQGGAQALSPAQQSELAARVKALDRAAARLRPRPEPEAKA